MKAVWLPPERHTDQNEIQFRTKSCGGAAKAEYKSHDERHVAEIAAQPEE